MNLNCPILPRRDHPELRARVREFLTEHMPSHDSTIFDPFDYHRGGQDVSEADVEWMQALAHAGFAAPSWPTEYGGGGFSRSESLAISEELSAAGAPPHLDVIGLGIIGPMLLETASEDQRRRWLRAMTTGEAMWCQLFSEPDYGSDLAAMATVATHNGDGYVVQGQKVWTSNADRARWGLLVTRLAEDKEADPPTAPAYVALVIDMRRPEVTFRPIPQPHGQATFCEVFLDGVPVPASDRIGAERDGWRVAIATLLYERAALGGFQLGITGPLLRLAAAIEDVPAPSRADALEVFCDGLVHQLAVVRGTLAGGSDGPPSGTEWFTLKVALARLNQRITDAIWRSRGMGATSGLGDADTRAMLRSRANTIEGGSSEVLLSNIGERLLGLPREPRVALTER